MRGELLWAVCAVRDVYACAVHGLCIAHVPGLRLPSVYFFYLLLDMLPPSEVVAVAHPHSQPIASQNQTASSTLQQSQGMPWIVEG